MLYIHEHTQNKGTRCSNKFLRNITMYYVSVYHLTRQYRMCHFTKKNLWVTWPNKQRQSTEGQWPVNSNGAIFNKSIGDDTKATARQSPNCIKKQKINLAKNDFQYGGWNYYTLQCRMWLWNHDIEFARWQHHAVCQLALGWHAIEFAQTSAILQFYIWFRAWPYHQSTCYSALLCNFIQIGPPQKKNMTSCRFPRWRTSAILDLRGPIMACIKPLAVASGGWKIWPSAYHRVPNMLLYQTSSKLNGLAVRYMTMCLSAMFSCRNLQLTLR